MEEKQINCETHWVVTNDLKKILKGNGQEGLVADFVKATIKIAKLEGWMKIITLLLLANGGLLSWTIYMIMNLKK